MLCVTEIGRRTEPRSVLVQVDVGLVLREFQQTPAQFQFRTSAIIWYEIRFDDAHNAFGP